MYAALLLGVAVTVAAPGPKESPKKEAPGIVGAWTLEKMEFGGMALPVSDVGQLSLTFGADGAVVARKNGQVEPDGGRFTHYPKKSPAEIDLTEGRAGGKDMTIKGIYKIDGETLTLCMTPMGDRPTKFESAGQTILMVFKRMKQD
jgi:uncharacterized protein (TIGR03067 family)